MRFHKELRDRCPTTGITEDQLSYLEEIDARILRNPWSSNAVITNYWGTNGLISKLTSSYGATYISLCALDTMLLSLILQNLESTFYAYSLKLFSLYLNALSLFLPICAPLVCLSGYQRYPRPKS